MKDPAIIQTCPLCNQLLFSERSDMLPICRNSACFSLKFSIGAKVLHRRNPSRGLGTITNILEDNSALKSDLHNQSDDLDNLLSIKRKSSPFKLKSSNRRISVNFPSYSPEFFSSFELRRMIWAIGERIRFKQLITYNRKDPISSELNEKKAEFTRNKGEILQIQIDRNINRIIYSVISANGEQWEIDEKWVIGTVHLPHEEFLQNPDLYIQANPLKFFLRIWGFQFHTQYASKDLKIITNSRLSLLSHQISVAHYLLQQTEARYILADEVGLGKTIEAGIFVKECIARKICHRVLIITPASITGQWEFEMKNKFGLKFTRLTSLLLKNLTLDLRTGDFIDNRTGKECNLCSVTLQYARLPQCAKKLLQQEWDIVIFDEAHHLRRYLTNFKTGLYRTTLAYDLGMQLSRKTRHLLLLTATPIQLHSFDLYSLIELLNPFAFSNYEEFEHKRKQLTLLNMLVRNLQNFKKINVFERNALPAQLLSYFPKYSLSDIEKNLQSSKNRNELIDGLFKFHFLADYVIRNRRRRVFPDHKIKRVPKLVEVELTAEEGMIYSRIHQYLAKIYSQNFESGTPGLGFVMVILQKLLTSSVPAVLTTMRKRIAYLQENREKLDSLRLDFLEVDNVDEETATNDDIFLLEGMDDEDRKIFKQREMKKIPVKKKPTLDVGAHINILQEFVQELEKIKQDTKAEHLLSILEEILIGHPDEKVLLFTQFKATLHYLAEIIVQRGFQVTEFHGDLTEHQKMQSVERFKTDIQIMLSTEIGGEGRNFQFCHVIINYDLPWNPMRLEQRIGRLDRIGQTQDVYIFNFFIRDTVESSIITAINDRIHLFEESIGALEPILGSLESKITEMVLKEDSQPLKFRLEEVIAKTGDQIDEIYDKLDDFILDKRSFQYDKLESQLNRLNFCSEPDFIYFLQSVNRYLHPLKIIGDVSTTGQFTIQPIAIPYHRGIWQITMSESIRMRFNLNKKVHRGVFSLDLAQIQEEFDFLALGNPYIMNPAAYFSYSPQSIECCLIQFPLTTFLSTFLSPFAARLPPDENRIFQHFASDPHVAPLHLFIYRIDFLGIISEQQIHFICLSSEGFYLPTVSHFLSRPHNWKHLLDTIAIRSDFSGDQLRDKHISDIPFLSPVSISEIAKNSKNALKTRLQSVQQIRTAENREAYLREKEKLIRISKSQKKYAEKQLERSQMMLKARKLKLASPRQREYADALTDEKKKQKRLQEFADREREVLFYANEVQRWQDILDEFEFDLPARLKRLERHRQLRIDAEEIGYCQIVLR